MPELALSASNATGHCAASAALRWPDGRVEFAATTGTQRGDPVALVARLCRGAGVRPEQIRELRLDLGPGSYVGLRGAVTFARFLQHFGSVPVLATDSLTLIASANRPHAQSGRRVVVVLDARRGRMHVAPLQWQSAGWRPEAAPAALAGERLPELLRTGDLLLATPSLHATLAPMAQAVGVELMAPAPADARELFAIGVPMRTAGAADLEPLYLMGSYAEEA
ncbi:MAG: tRNA (adenosine(37)-N6)-threonylcarbamoyltransferase complex dimerization subunit type 1 TsaB [Planctomycetes bacterium]|nr:tRNA (adenosine(37)-N6)-threonylcarbamoyltransferase complex dimerization subunit type 1 TsaB [Planctomycetota bacterium]